MRKRYSILTFIICALALVLCGAKGFAQTPPYTGTIDSKLKIPCAKDGKNYHLTGDRLGGSGSGVSKGYVDSLFSSGISQAYVDSLFASLSIAMLQDTTTATIGDVAGVGLVTPMDQPHNTFGRVRYTNNTGGVAGSGKQIKVAYNTPYDFQAVPVVSLVSQIGTVVRLLIKDPQPDSFIIELKDDIPNGQSVEITYHVKAE